ncbi:hypothetical protein D3C85_1146540 [compost metagenome]
MLILMVKHLRVWGFYRILLSSMKIKQTVVTFGMLIGMGAFISAPAALAAECGGVQTSIISCSEGGKLECKVVEKDEKGNPKKDASGNEIVNTTMTNGRCSDGSAPNPIDSNGVWGILKLAINIMTAGVGILAVGGIVYGSILYTSAGGSSEQTKKAMGIITNVVIGLIAYALMYAITNFLIPGGLFS